MAASATLPFLPISLLILFIYCSHIISCFAIAITTTNEGQGQGQGQVPSSVTPKAAAVQYWHLKTRNNKPLPPVILSKLSPLSPTKLITTTDETMRPYDKYASQERPYDKYASQERPYDKYASQERPYDKYASQERPYDKYASQERPYDKYASQERPYDKYASQERPYDKYASQERPYDKYASQERPYDKYTSQERPYDKYASQERPYDKYASQERPYDKYAPQDGHATASDDAKSATYRYNSVSNNNVKMVMGDEVKEKAAEQNDPRGIFSEDRPYDKYASQDRRPYDKYASQERPYDKYASQDRRPYDKYASQERPYDKYASQDGRPYDKYASQDGRPYDKYASQERPYDKYASQDDRPYDKYASQERPYDKYASQDGRPYDKYASQERPYDKYASQDGRPYDKYASKDLHVSMMGDEVKEKAAEQNDPQGIFFRESELKEGKTIPLLKFESSGSSNYFLPRSIASKIPLSASAVSRIFHIPTDSATYTTMKITIGHCRMPPNTGETSQCVTSAEDLIDYAISTMGPDSDIQVWSTHSSIGFGGKSLIGKVKVVHDGVRTGKQHVACHQLTFPYLVYHCHTVSNTRVYDVEILDGETKEKINQGVALCHMDTSAWDPNHMSFAALGSAPGKTEVCHWIHPWDMTLTPTAATS